jgi:hypothetical protein
LHLEAASSATVQFGNAFRILILHPEIHGRTESICIQFRFQKCLTIDYPLQMLQTSLCGFFFSYAL